MDIKTILDARDSLQARLSAALAEWDRIHAKPSNTEREIVRMNQLDGEVRRLVRGIERLEDLAATK